MESGKNMPPPPQGLVEDRPLPSWIASKQSAKQLLSKRGYGDAQPATTTVKRVDAGTAEDRSRLDHSNIKKSWKHPDIVANETRGRERQKQNRNPQPIRPYAGGVRVTKVLDSSPVATFAKSHGTRKRFVVDEAGPMGTAEFAATQNATTSDGADELELTQQLAPELMSKTLASEPNFLKIDQSTLPIEIFDSIQFEDSDRAPEQWVESCSGGVVPYFANGDWKWRRCEVQSYDAETKMFKVKLGQRHKEVRRLNILFDNEDKGTWEDRRRAARDAREEAKQRLRFDYYIRKQAMDEFRPIQQVTLRGIHEKIADGLPNEVEFPEQGTPGGQLLRKLTKDVIQGYTRTMKQAISAYKYKSDASVRETYETLKLPPAPPTPPPPMFGKVSIPAHAYDDCKQFVADNHFSALREVLVTFKWLYDTWENMVAQTHFMDTDLATLELPCQLEDFAAVQKARCAALQDILKNDWRRSFAEHLVDNVQDVHDFFQSNQAAYQAGPLWRLLKHAELRMASQLRQLVDASLESWLVYIGKYTASTETEGTGTDTSGKHPLLSVDLVVSDGKLEIQPSEQEMQTVMTQVVDEMVAATRTMQNVDADLMSLLHLEPRKVFNVGVGDPLYADVDAKLQSACNRITDAISLAMRGPRELAKNYEVHAEIMQMETETFLADFVDKEPSLEEFIAKVREFHGIAKAVEDMSNDEEIFTLTKVNTTGAKETLVSKALELRNALMDQVVYEARVQNDTIIERYESILKRIAQKPVNEAELAALKEFITKSKADVLGIMEEVDDIHRRLDALDEFGYAVPQEDIYLAWSTMEFPKKVDSAALECEMALEEDKIRMMERLALEKDKFEDLLVHFEAEVKRAKAFDNYETQETHCEEINSLQDQITEAKLKAADFNEREKVFGFMPTDYITLGVQEKELEPFFKLWNMISEFHTSQQEYLHGSFLELDGKAIQATVDGWWKDSFKLSKVLEEEHPGPSACAAKLREDTSVFRQHLPVIQSLASKALKERHWEALGEKLGDKIVPDEELTLQYLLELNAGDHIEELQEVCVAAEKEYSLERTLANMKIEWGEIKYDVKEYKETGTFVVGGIDDIITLLDDHIVKTQTMRGSMFIGAIEDDAKAWEQQLKYAQHLIEEWLNCQKTWMYLEPIFSSEDIMRQLPTEARRFQGVDRLWRTVMVDTEQDPVFINQAALDKKLVENFKLANEKLDKIQKGLNDYLEVKRLYFPRFFFLSPDQLIEILSQSKEPRAVQPHLNKAFEGVNTVQFEDDLKITYMISSESERVKFIKVIDPESSANKGNVERWLDELEKSQWLSIRDQVELSRNEFPTLERTKWVVRWPAQVILLVSQIFWTQEVTREIQDNGTPGLERFAEESQEAINKIVFLVRGKLSKLDRKTIGALCVIDVHAVETIRTMVKAHVDTIGDFEWISQLRYYWQEAWKDGQACKEGEPTAVARIVNARCLYGYEYLGNSMRLVITQLTDRCYRTMISAIDLLYGGAPEGPAGTGKTETVKDLSKAVAIQCVVFNCSDGLDYLAMAKFFKGLAGCGSWCCFDEFNRINVEVLSVIAQQILTINRAKAAGVAKFQFEGTYMQLNQNCNVFITMNPGYAGRAELPDNLKALFRPCAMMVPDYALIGMIRLLSFGFEDAYNNAKKLVMTLTLCSEQLSSQKHYDYGMRAVNSILVAAGSLRQVVGDLPEWTEAKIVMRSVYDVNLPKFTVEDLPLFFGITSDLFPGVELPHADHGALPKAIDDQCTEGVKIAPGKKIKVDPVPAFTNKVLQLYEMVLVRHGVMVVGQTASGKTAAIHALSQAMTVCNENGEPYEKVQIHTMNPKSILSGQLYGNFDENTHEWSDGVLAIIYRNCAFDTTPNRQWLVFDGPVDAVWIENMNTVLDDNKKLCLNSGEIIKMTDRMTMMFEAEDLEQASPATVSRVGMIFCETRNLGWKPLRKVWLDALPEAIVPHRELLSTLFDWLVPPITYFVEKRCKVPTPVTDQELMSSLLRLLTCQLEAPDGLASDLPKVLECAFIKGIIWSAGACVDSDGRVKFDVYLRALLADNVAEDEAHLDFLSKNREYVHQERKAIMPPPEGALVHDFRFDMKKAQWFNWVDPSSRFGIPKDASFTSVVVPTVDTIRSEWLITELLTNGFHVLCTGDTGTGKSVSVKNHKLLNGSDDSWMSISVNFSAQTTANATQDIIDGKLDKRRKGVLGPPLNKTCVVFVDDLNMPAKEEYGAQPPIEILRQWMDHAGWYNRDENEYRQIVDTQFIAAMGPPGGGRTRITQRYVRHFNVVNFVPFDGESLQRVFGTILDWVLSKGFSSGVKSISAPMVVATVDVYETIAKNLLPTPMKSHYTFNLRDLSKVFQGVSQGSADLVKDKEQFIRLWSHECLRVFHDRLVTEDDRQYFTGMIAEKVTEHFAVDFNKKICPPGRALMYGNFIDPKVVINKKYDEISDPEVLSKVMEGYLEDYNANTTKPMSLVLFENAVEHVSRISRVINQPYGNALLVGVGGSGRKSLTTLAVSMADFALRSIVINRTYGMFEWREDLKSIFMVAGVQNEPTVFLFDDTQIVNESFLEDINGILNTGEVPNLFNSEEMVAVNEGLSKDARDDGINAGNPAEMYAYFISRVRSNLHVVLCLSPIGDAFRTRLLMFPALVNCCTIDWFTAWPEEALRSVAKYFLDSISLDDEVRNGLVDVCVNMQEKTTQMAERYKNEMERYYYVTPTSYLELINTFKSLLNKQRDEVLESKNRYDNGLTKIFDTQTQVDEMQKYLTDLQPKLDVATKETDALLIRIDKDTKEANASKAIVTKDETECQKQADEANAIKASCEADLAEAIPALEGAVKALNSLSKGDIFEVKQMKKPPGAVRLVMETICIMMGVKPEKIKDPEGGNKKIDDYWEASKKNLLNRPNLIQDLMDYDKDNIEASIVTKVSVYTQNPDFEPEKVKKGSVAASGMCKWVHAMVIYDRVAKNVAPKKASLAAANESLSVVTLALAEKQATLKALMDKLAELQKDLDAAEKKKSDLQTQVSDCATKLKRAEQLINGLGGERDRWSQLSIDLGLTYENVTGDIMLSAGQIAYTGSFVSSYRSEAIDAWSDLLGQKKITCSNPFSLRATLGQEVEIRDWVINKLPNDSFSIDNAIMLERSNRWPLMIDPQGQANKWVKKLEGEPLKVIKQNNPTFVRSIEIAIQFGNAVLLENVPETLDPVLEPVLLRQVVTVGGVATIKLGDNVVEYDHKFKMYITTKLSNPHYPPEICVKVNLLNFMATQDGLQDQMLGLCVAKEQPVLEEQRETLVLEDADNKRQLKDIEDTILRLLKEAKGNILDDEVLIETLAKSKITSNEIEKKVKQASRTQETIATVRASYTPVAFHVGSLFFCIADLASINSMYQYSLEWYINLFMVAIDKAPKSDVFEERLEHLNVTFTEVLYVNVCRSLFAKDKLLFSFLLTTKIMLGADTLDPRELRYLLQGDTAMDLISPNPMKSGWLSDKIWGEILAVAQLPAFTGLNKMVEGDLAAWQVVYDAKFPAEPLAELLTDKMSMFQQICVCRAVRPDAVVPEIQKFIAAQMGQRFIEPPPFDLKTCYEDSTCSTPLIFVLTPGADPMTELFKLADELGFGDKKLKVISLGQGQGKLAEEAIREARDGGKWVCLQNCHLCVSWLPMLEMICENLSPELVRPEFRLWLSSEPSPAFPAFILQNGVKMTNEPPKGIRANMRGSYYEISEEFLESCKRPAEFKKLIFGLCFFHASVRERRKFGALGWNIQYVFSGPDLRISMDQLKIMLDELPEGTEVPYRALCYLTGECNYGGRVTDGLDRRTIMNILTDFYTAEIQDDTYRFSPNDGYYVPGEGSHADYCAYIQDLPMNEGPEIFGLNENANISFALAETDNLLSTALSLQPKSGGGEEKSWDDVVGELAADISKRLPTAFDVEKALLDFPVKYDESMNTVVTQELSRFNLLTECIESSLKEIMRAIAGLVVLGPELKAMGDSMVIAQVPGMWTDMAYPSLKPMGGWVTDLLLRLEFLGDWVDKMKAPNVFWVSGFFFTQAFITGTKQNYARKYQYPIDEVDYDNSVLRPPEMETARVEGAPDGSIVSGLFLDSARFDVERHVIAEANPRELFVPMPYFHLLPRHMKDIEGIEGKPELYTGEAAGTCHVYMCPLYKTSIRFGRLSTTGHSTNFVMSLRVPMEPDHGQKHWIKRGVAMLTQLDD